MSKIQIRRDTADFWEGANPVLAEGELGLELGSFKFKVGDGTKAWNDLDYIFVDAEIPTDILKSGDNVSELVNDVGYLTTALQSGDNISELTNDVGYVTNALQSGDNISELANDVGYLVTALQPGDNVSKLFNDAGYLNQSQVNQIIADGGFLTDALQSGDNVSELVNDAGYLTTGLQSGDNVSELTNDAGYLIDSDVDQILTDGGYLTTALQPGDNVSDLNNDAGYLTTGLQSGDNVSELANDAGYLTTGLQSGDNVSELVNDANYLTTSSSIGDLGDVTMDNIPPTGHYLKWDGSSWVSAPGPVTEGEAVGIELTDLSAATVAPGVTSLTYNDVSGVFTYTPPDLSAYLTSYTEIDPVFTASPAFGISGDDIANWNTAHSWGDHSVVGYATGTELSNATANSANWDTAFSWGDHSQVGYLTAEADTLATVVARGNTTGGDIQFGSNKAKFSNNDLEIYHNGSNGYIDNATGELYIRDTNATGTNRIFIQPKSGENGIVAYEDGQVELYFDNSKKLNTSSVGVTVTGALTAGGLTYPTTDGSNGQVLVTDGAGNLTFTNSRIDTLNDVVSRGNTSTQAIEFTNSGRGVNFQTSSNNDFQIYGMSDQQAYIVHAQNNGAGGAGDLNIIARNGLHVYGGSGKSAAAKGLEVKSGSATLLHQGSEKLKTNEDGVTVTGALTAGGLTYPTTDGSNGQVLVTDGDGNLTFNNLSYTVPTLQEVTDLGATTTNTITASGGITVPNGKPVTIGDITIENRTFPATGSLIETSGDLLIKSGRLLINNRDNSGNMIIGRSDGSVELFYDNVKKFETTSTGVTVTGALTAGGLTYPTTNGTSGQVLTSDGAGNVTWAADSDIHVINVKDYGAIGDGNSNENDSPAIQSAFDAAQDLLRNGKPAAVYFPSGIYYFDSKVVINVNASPANNPLGDFQGLTVFGDGTNSSLLVASASNSVGILEITSPGNTEFYTVRDMSFLSPLSSGDNLNGTALEINSTLLPGTLGFGDTQQRTVDIRNIRVAGFADNVVDVNQDAGRFEKGIVVQHKWYPSIDNVVVKCAPNTSQDYASGRYGIHLFNCYSPEVNQAYVHGPWERGINHVDDGADTEDFRFNNSFIVGPAIGIYIDHNIDPTALREPGGTIIGNHVNCIDRGIMISKHRQVNITNNYFYMTKGDVAAYRTGVHPCIHVKDSDDIIISNNQFCEPGFYDDDSNCSAAIMTEGTGGQFGGVMVWGSHNTFNHGGISLILNHTSNRTATFLNCRIDRGTGWWQPDKKVIYSGATSKFKAEFIGEEEYSVYTNNIFQAEKLEEDRTYYTNADGTEELTHSILKTTSNTSNPSRNTGFVFYAKSNGNITPVMAVDEAGIKLTESSKISFGDTEGLTRNVRIGTATFVIKGGLITDVTGTYDIPEDPDVY